MRDLNNWYRRWATANDIEHLILMESKPTKIFGMIVKPDSADPGLPTDAIFVDENHESICKPISNTSEVFLHIQNFISKKLPNYQTTWIKEKFGQPLQGWRSYGNWANCPDGTENTYLSDDDVRFINTSSRSEGMSGIDGIHAIRNLLHKPASCARLTGLSGVGKTRLLQALFDERIGNNPLNKSQVFYTDISDSPNPAPRNFVEQLLGIGKPTILAVDNCPPDLHRRLASVCSSAGSLVSLVTVEYDVREDQPEETQVFRLEAASDNLIQKVIRSRFDYISQIDSQTIAKFSGGNSRIAIALATTVKRGENLSNLKDTDLFERLFHQRNQPDYELLKAAEVCSLVYSFDCNTDTESKELQVLCSLSDIPVKKLYELISELKRRELIQQRSYWRAILPHAIANRLAQRALENIPLNDIYSAFEANGLERMLKSFAKRLSFLHDHEIAIKIAKRWLTIDGLLSDVGNLNEVEMVLLGNIAPIAPEAVLDSIEKASKVDESGKFLSRENPNYVELTRLLRSLAYDNILFPRAVNLIIQFALSENRNENTNSIRSLLKSLFYIVLSGTHATAEQRLKVISELIESGSENKVELAFELLSAALKIGNFRVSHSFEFGARSRDHGFWPKDMEEQNHWFKLFVEYTVGMAASKSPLAISAKSILAQKFRGLWSKAHAYDLLETAVKEIVKENTWREGWVAVKSTLRFDKKNMGSDLVSRLNNLEKLLESMPLVERVRLYAISDSHSPLDMLAIVEVEGGKASDSYTRVQKITRALGKDVANNKEILFELLPELLSKRGSRLFDFGQGLADGCKEPLVLWNTFKQHIDIIDYDLRNYQLLCGFLNALSEKSSDPLNTILDEAMEDSVFGKSFPILQASASIDSKGINRLIESLEKDLAPIINYQQLAYGRSHEKIPDNDLCQILSLISEKDGGVAVAIEILQMRLHGVTEEVDNVVSDFAQKLLLACDFSNENWSADRSDYGVGEIIKKCFNGKSAVKSAKALCEKLAQALINWDISGFECGHVLNALSTMQPSAFINGFFGDNEEIHYRILSAFSEDVGHSPNPLCNIKDEIIIEWCEANSKIRYPLIATAIQAYQNDSSNNELSWTNLSQKIIVNSPDPIEVLNAFKSNFKSPSSGSRADTMSKHLPMIASLVNHENPVISEWAGREKIQFQNEIASEKKWEQEHYGYRDERFE